MERSAAIRVLSVNRCYALRQVAHDIFMSIFNSQMQYIPDFCSCPNQPLREVSLACGGRTLKLKAGASPPTPLLERLRRGYRSFSPLPPRSVSRPPSDVIGSFRSLTISAFPISSLAAPSRCARSELPLAFARLSRTSSKSGHTSDGNARLCSLTLGRA